MGLRDILSSLRPGLPSLTRDRPEVWAIDTDTTAKDIHSFDFLFLVSPRHSRCALLANRTGEGLEFTEHTRLIDETTEKEYMTFGGRPVFVKRFRLPSMNAMQEIPDEKLEKPPDDMLTQSYPPKEFTEKDAAELDDIFG